MKGGDAYGKVPKEIVMALLFSSPSRERSERCGEAISLRGEGRSPDPGHKVGVILSTAQNFAGMGSLQ